MSAFSARAARGDRPAQAGRGPGARGERNAVAGCSWSMSLLLSPKDRTRRLQRRALSHLRSHCSRLITPFLDLTAECRTPFREPLQCIVIAIMSVMSGTFPYTNGVFYMTVNCQCIWGPSYRRHVYRLWGNQL